MKKFKLRKSFAALMMAFVMLLSVLPTAAFAADAAIEEGSYKVPITELKSGAPIPAIANEFAKSFGTEVQVDVAADGAMTATIIPQHMVVNMGGEYHCNLLKLKSAAGEATYPEMRTEKSSQMFGAPDQIVDLEVPAKMVVALPALNENGVYPLELTCDMMNCLNGGLELDHWMDVTLKLDWAKAESMAPNYTFGTAKTVLMPGMYTLPVSLMNASHIENPSMAASCIKGGALEVMEDGSAFVTVDLGPVTVGPLTGWSGEWNIYAEPDYKKIDETSVKTPAEVLTKDDAGNETSIRFQLPYTDQDGVYAQMFVALMGMRPDGYLALDFAKAEKATNPDPQPQPDDKIADGNYYVDAYLWHETQDKPSMGDTAMENNRKVLVTVADGVVTNVQVATAPVSMGPITSAIIDVKVNGQDVEILKKAPFTTAPAGNDYEYIQLFQFALPTEAQPTELAGATYTPIQFKVPDTPMGEDFMDARIKLDWSSAAATEDTQIALPEPEPEKTDVDLMDEATGVKIHAPAGTFDEEVILVVEKITEGDAYENAAAVVESVGEKFDLYAIRFVNAEGKEVKAQGPVTISVPVADDFDADALVMYRVNADGTKTLVRGEVGDGCFIFLQKTFGTYALVEEGSVIEEGTTPEQPEQPENKPETDPEAKPENPDEKPEDPTAPETGDSTQLMMLTVAALAAAAGAAFVVSAKRRNEN